MCTCHWQSLGSELLHTTTDDEMMRKMSWIQIELNWIQIELRRNEIQTGAQDIENLYATWSFMTLPLEK